MRRYLAAVDPQVSSKSPEGITAFRQAAEAALAAAGLHLTEAAALWQEYRCALPSLLQQQHRHMAATGVPSVLHCNPEPPLAHTGTPQPCLPGCPSLHPALAHVVNLCRSYEQAVLSEGKGGDKQAEAVRQLYQRQLQTPQPSAQQLLHEYEEWEKETGHVSWDRAPSVAACTHAPVRLTWIE